MEYLFIFIVEEDKSFFHLRIDIISSETFPSYFRKEKIKEQDNICINEDLRIFAQYVAPLLNIKYRFVGEESTDYVTNQYDITMKRILPALSGIHVIEIPRKCMNGEAISATKVRKYYKQKDFIKMETLVPETTLNFLMKKAENFMS